MDIARLDSAAAIDNLAGLAGIAEWHEPGQGMAVLAAVLGVVFFAIGIIVANAPEGLLPTVTLSLAMGAVEEARKWVMRRAPAR